MRDKNKRRTKAIILAAGRSTRLRPLTAEVPKCLLCLNDETILDYQLRRLAKLGIKCALIVTGYKRGLIQKHIERSDYDLAVTIVDNKLFYKTDNAYSLSLALEHVDPAVDAILVLDGDILFEFELLRRLVESPHDNACIVENGKKIEPEDCKIVIKNGSAVSIGKSVPGNTVFTSMIKMSNELLTEFKQALKEPRARLEWYSEPLNRLLLKFPSAMHVLCTDGMLRCEIDTYDDLVQARAIRQRITQLEHRKHEV
jgi:choline kinase